MYKLQGEVS